jgi:DNA-directed RNA polymerase specialized sigma24 family protein
MGYLSAVRRYLTRSTLRRYAFSTIAWKSMGRSIAAFHQAEALRVQAEQRYVEMTPRRDPMEELEARLFLHDLASVASRPQYELAALRLQGYSIAETARQSGMTPKRVRSLLRELYRVYFQLYPREP